MTEPTTADVAPDEHTGLWRGDAGELPDRTRRVLLRLVRGPYLSGAREAQLWAVLLTDEAVLRQIVHTYTISPRQFHQTIQTRKQRMP